MRGSWGNAFRNDYDEPAAMTVEELNLFASVTVSLMEGKKVWHTVTSGGQLIGYVKTRFTQSYRLPDDEEWRYVAGDWNRLDPPHGRAVLALLKHLENLEKEKGELMAEQVDSLQTFVGRKWLGRDGEPRTVVGIVRIGGEECLEVADGDKQFGSFGNELLPPEDLEATIARDERNNQSRIEREQREQVAQKAPQDKQAAIDAKYEGFIAGKSSMQAGKIKQTLEQKVSRHGKVMSRSDLVEQLVVSGYQVEAVEVPDYRAKEKARKEYDLLRRTAPTGNENHPKTIRLREVEKIVKGEVRPTLIERRLTAPDGGYLTQEDLTKTGMDYAEYFCAQLKDDLDISGEDLDGEQDCGPSPR